MILFGHKRRVDGKGKQETVKLCHDIAVLCHSIVICYRYSYSSCSNFIIALFKKQLKNISILGIRLSRFLENNKIKLKTDIFNSA